MRIAFFASHNGSAAKVIAQACERGDLTADPVLLIGNNPGAGAFAWAVEMQVKSYCLNEKNMGSADALDQEIAYILADHAIDLVVCSGYMKLIGPKTIDAVKGRILNVHPALLPRHGGQGMYGRKVHDAVVAGKEIETGITIHLVNGEYDKGPIIAQHRLPVRPGDSAEDVENRVKAAEPDFYIETLRSILSGDIKLP
jgi:phosphoribosylglycinamide formyltransferase-1